MQFYNLGGLGLMGQWELCRGTFIYYFSLLFFSPSLHSRDQGLHQIHATERQSKHLAPFIINFFIKISFPSLILFVKSLLVSYSLPKSFFLLNYRISLLGSLHANPFSPNSPSIWCIEYYLGFDLGNSLMMAKDLEDLKILESFRLYLA